MLAHTNCCARAALIEWPLEIGLASPPVGLGVPQYVDGHSPWYGHGRINAHEALALAAGDSEERLPAVLYLEHRISKPIPDPGETEDTIPFPLDVAINSIEVSVDIRHTWRGDLRLTLAAPDGSQIVLLDGTGGSRDDVVQSFRSSDQPALFAGLVGASAAGDWRLKVKDMIAHDAGTIVKWGLAIGYR